MSVVIIKEDNYSKFPLYYSLLAPPIILPHTWNRYGGILGDSSRKGELTEIGLLSSANRKSIPLEELLLYQQNDTMRVKTRPTKQMLMY